MNNSCYRPLKDLDISISAENMGWVKIIPLRWSKANRITF